MSTFPAQIVKIASRYADLPGVIAVAFGGSRSGLSFDGMSDLDLYVYCAPPPSLDHRTAIAHAWDPWPEIGNTAFGDGDEWRHEPSGLKVDVMYWSSAWIEEQVARVLDQHLPSVGYSTALVRTIQQSDPIVDSTGWFSRLQTSARRPYPDQLRRAIVDLNWPLVRGAQSSFLTQIEMAIARHDAVSVIHRTAALLASWFDVLFALNRVMHPGEKRLVAIALAECEHCPGNLAELIEAVIGSIAPPWSEGRLVATLNRLVSSLVPLVETETAQRPSL